MRKKMLISLALVIIMMFNCIAPLMQVQAVVTAAKEITFNSDLYYAVKSELKKQNADFKYNDKTLTIEISADVIATITEMNLNEKGISNLEGLEEFSSLTRLEISGNNLSEESHLDVLGNLKLNYLDLSSNKIGDVSMIDELISNIQNNNGTVVLTNQAVVNAFVIENTGEETIEVELPSILEKAGFIKSVWMTSTTDGPYITEMPTSINADNKNIVVNIENNGLLKFEIKIVDSATEAGAAANKNPAAKNALKESVFTTYVVIHDKESTGIYIPDTNLYNEIKKQITKGQLLNSELASYPYKVDVNNEIIFEECTYNKFDGRIDLTVVGEKYPKYYTLENDEYIYVDGSGKIYSDLFEITTIKTVTDQGDISYKEGYKVAVPGENRNLYKKAYDEAQIFVISNRDLMNKITSLILNNKQIRDLTGIEYFVGLNSDLNVSHNYLNNIDPLYKLQENKDFYEAKLQEEYAKLLEKLSEKLSDMLASQEEIDTNMESISETVKSLIEKIKEVGQIKREKTVTEKVKDNYGNVVETTKVVENENYEKEMSAKIEEIKALYNEIYGYNEIDEVTGKTKHVDGYKELIDEALASIETYLADIYVKLADLYDTYNDEYKLLTLLTDEMNYLTLEEYVTYNEAMKTKAGKLAIAEAQISKVSGFVSDESLTALEKALIIVAAQNDSNPVDRIVFEEETEEGEENEYTFDNYFENIEDEELKEKVKIEWIEKFREIATYSEMANYCLIKRMEENTADDYCYAEEYLLKRIKAFEIEGINTELEEKILSYLKEDNGDIIFGQYTTYCNIRTITENGSINFCSGQYDNVLRILLKEEKYSESEVKALFGIPSDIDDQIGDLEGNIRIKDDEIQSINNEIKEHEDEIKEYQATIEANEKEIENKNSELITLKNDLKNNTKDRDLKSAKYNAYTDKETEEAKGLAGEIAVLNTLIAEIEQEIKEIEEDIVSCESNIRIAEDDIAFEEERITEENNEKAVITKERTQLLEQLTALRNQKASFEDTMRSLGNFEIIKKMSLVEELDRNGECVATNLYFYNELVVLANRLINSNVERYVTLPDLKKLDISYNAYLEGIERLGELSYLRELQANANYITNIEDVDWTALKYLRKVGLAYNYITDITPLEALENVVDLNVSHNLLAGEFKFNLTKVQKTLKNLDLSYNQMEDITRILEFLDRKSGGNFANYLAREDTMNIDLGHQELVVNVEEPILLENNPETIDIALPNIFVQLLAIDAERTSIGNTSLDGRIESEGRYVTVNTRVEGNKSGKVEIIPMPNAETCIGNGTVATINYSVGKKLVSNVVIHEEIAELEKGTEVTFTATVEGANLEDKEKTVTWSLEGAQTEGTTINENGVLVVSAEETAEVVKVVATSDYDTAVKAEKEIRLFTKTLTEVKIKEEIAELEKGTETIFTVEVIGENLTEADKEITWSLEGAQAEGTTINEKGVLVVSAEETAETITVTVTSNYDNTKFDTRTISIIKKSVTGVTVTGNTTAKAGEKVTFIAEVNGEHLTGAEKAVTWELYGATSAYTRINKTTGELTISADEKAEVLTVAAVSNYDETKVGTIEVKLVVVRSVTVEAPSNRLYNGNSMTLTAKVEGSNLTDAEKAVTWEVVGATDVATTITEAGVLTIGENETAETITVIATSKVDSEVSGTKEIKIDIPLPTLGYDVDTNGNVIVGVSPATIVESFKAKFITDNNYTVEVKRNGTIIEDTKYIATGDIVVLKSGNKVVDAFEVVVKGDVNGDGLADALDSSLIKAHRARLTTLSGLFYQAADIDNSGDLDVRDVRLLLYHRARIEGYIL